MAPSRQRVQPSGAARFSCGVERPHSARTRPYRRAMKSTGMIPVSWLRPRRVAFIAAVIGTALASEMYVIQRIRYPASTPANLFMIHIAFWLIWAACVPVAIRVAAQVDRSTLSVPVRLAVHLGTAVLLGILNTAIVHGLRIAFGFIGADMATLSAYFGFVSWQLTSNLLAYGLIVGIYHTSASESRARTTELTATRLREELALARLATLRSQLQPHFLFNTLNTVSSLIDDDPSAARRTVTLLSHLLRESLARANDDVIRLRDELAFVDRYLDIERVRYGERLQVEREIDGPSLDQLVPSYVLVPLVENAVKHGVARHAGVAHVRLSTRLTADDVRLSVSNSGGWSDADPSPGTGLSRLRGRLAALYGERAFLNVIRSKNDEVRVDVIIPHATGSVA